MGLKNGNAIFSKGNGGCSTGVGKCGPYVDDVIVGSTGDTEEELINNHERDVRKALQLLADARLVVDPKKAQLFVREVEFCGHILREGQRFPAPGKLRALEKWELPRTLCELRGFLGFCNYYEEYVPQYVMKAWKLMEKLKVKGPEAKSGSKLRLTWHPLRSRPLRI